MFREVKSTDQYTPPCVHGPPAPDDWVGYADYISCLLDSRPILQHPLMTPDIYHGATNALELPDENPQELPWPVVDALSDTWEVSAVLHRPELTLVTVADSQPSWWQRLLWRPSACRALRQISGSILFARNPRWPLRHILVVVRVHASDGLALDWAQRLALLSEATVTLLPIVPPYPRLHQQDSIMLQGLDVLLAPDTITGEAIYRYARHLDQLGIRGTVCWKQGSIAHQICGQAPDTGYDLIVVADEPVGRWSRWFLGDLVKRLIAVANCSILVAR